MESATMNRVAVVTGAASGMGLAIARHLAARGDRVGLLDLQGEAALRAAKELRETGATAIAAEVDVTDRGAVDAALDQVRAELGPIGIMVTSAGLDAFEPFTGITIESWERVLAVNLTGTFHCLQSAVPDMLEARWGRLVTISSSSAQSGAPRMAHYVASKCGVIGLTRALALELAPHGITVNNIPPGMIDTPMLRRAEAGGDIGKLEKIAPRMIPVGRAGTPEDIAATCGFLCSDAAGFITGQVIGVNGGMVL
jgi:2-hydroxycyclohexanecarboxyl-CoA dehydrogenase